MTELQILVLKSDITTLRQLLQNMLALPIHEMDRRARVKECLYIIEQTELLFKASPAVLEKQSSTTPP